ncbi:MAG: 50S ribosomal protein L25/general stress protein Ctc [Chloroherpetonaceae bacterium]|nr:50S ribosomal protein L25/general stress protein Ctc [Chloroherpetonaceae bacterium]MDW8438189.1 50S ribosomal protein L25/general stress protein Ctc [Chloroherpetonaceae bacterium]
MQTITLEAELRSPSTKGKLKALRKNGFVPAVLYHKGDAPIALAVKEIPLRKLIYTTESHIVNLKLPDGTERQAVMKDAQFDPVTDVVSHVDFQGLKADEPIELEVPTLFKGTPQGAIKGGKVQVLMHKLSIKCLPADIPEHLEFDISHLEIGQSLHISDARKVYAGGKIQILGDDSVSIVTIFMPKSEIAAATETAAAAQPEVIAKGKEAKEAKKEGDAKK